MRKKYITFGIEADNIQNAKQRLERIETDIINNFKILGVRAFSLNGMERLELLHSCFNGGENKFKFLLEFDLQNGLTTKDFIAPTSFNFSDGRCFRMGGTIGASFRFAYTRAGAYGRNAEKFSLKYSRHCRSIFISRVSTSRKP